MYSGGVVWIIWNIQAAACFD